MLIPFYKDTTKKASVLKRFYPTKTGEPLPVITKPTPNFTNNWNQPLVKQEPKVLAPSVTPATDFVSDIVKSFRSTVSKPFVPKPTLKSMEFRVGDGLNDKQTKTAYDNITNPDTAMKEGQDNQFFNIIKNGIVKEFSPREEAVSIRRPFEINPIQTKAPPIVTQLGSLGFSIIEAIPRLVETMGGELAARGKPTTVKANIDLRRLGFDTPDYVTAAKEQQDAINNGENPWESGLRIMSNKTLDIAFGAGLLSDLAKMSTGILLRGGVQSKIEAQNILDAYKQNQTEVFARLKNAPLAEREKVLSNLANTKAQAEKIIKAQGAPTATDYARVNASRYTEVLGRQTPVTKNIFKDILKPDYNLKTPINNALLENPKLLPGQREVPGQSPAFGLSTKEVENVGYGNNKSLTGLQAEQLIRDGKINELKTYLKNQGRSKSNIESTISSIKEKISRLEPEINLITEAKKYKSAEELGLNVKEGGHILDKLPKTGVETLKIDSNLLGDKIGLDTRDLQKQTTGKLTSNYWLNKIQNGERPAILIGVEDGKLKVIDGNHRATAYLQENIKDVPVIFTNEAKSQLTDIWNKANNNISNELIKQPTKVIPEINNEIIKPIETKQISPVDKLIVEGKIRVKSVDNKDIYQYKNPNNEWKNAFSEDDAVLKATREPKPKYEPKVQEKIDFTKASLENVRETLNEHPAKPLLKFVKEGEFLDFKNPNFAKNTQEAEKIKAKNKKIELEAEKAFQDNPELQDKFDNPDTIREVIQDYRRQRDVEKSLVASRKWLEENAKPIGKIIREKFRPKVSQLDTTEGWGRSIEIQANQALSVLEGEVFPMDISFPKIIENTITPVKKKVHVIDTYLRTPHFVMGKIGFGKEAEMLREGSDAYWKELPKNIEKISNWLKRLKTKDAQEAVFDWLDGKAITLPFYEKEVAKEIKKWLKDWSVRLKLPEDEKITHYITHLFSDEIIEKEFDEELAKIITDKIPKGTYDPFLLERLGVKGYKRDLGLALDAYVKRATRKVHMDPALEAIRNRAGVQLEFTNLEKSQFKYIQRYIENIQMRPTEIEEGLDNFVKSVIGYKFGQRPTTALLKFFRQATFRGMLGLNVSSALRNISQGINTYAVLGEKNTTLGYLKLFNRGASEELAREGVLNAGFVQDRALTSTKKILEKLDKALFVFFDTAEKINRGAAYFGAKTKYYSEHIKKVNGVEVLPKTIEEDAIKYAKGIVRKTQFLFDAIDTPVGMSSTLAKTLLQFQTFSVKQTEFLTQLAKDRNFAGLLRYILAGLAFTYTIGKSFGMDPTELIPFSSYFTGQSTLGQAPPSLKFPIEVGKAVLNTPDKFGNTRSLEQKGKDIFKSAIGLFPAGSQMNKTVNGILAINEGGSFSANGQLQFTQGITPLQKTQAIIFGKYASENAKEYFDKEKTDYSSVKPIYEKAQELIKEGKTEEAKVYVNEVLDDTQKALYKTYKTQQKTLETLQGKKDILPFYLKMQELKKTNVEEARRLVNELPDNQKKYYQLIKDQVEKDKNASVGIKPEYEDGEVQTASGIIGTVLLYAKALKTDPINAFKGIFTKEQLEYVKGNAVILKRIEFKGEKGSESIAQKRAKEIGVDRTSMKLDHLIPRELGGGNGEDNLVLVPTEQWASYTPVENYLGKQLRAGKITKKQAQDTIIKFKRGEITADQAKSI